MGFCLCQYCLRCISWDISCHLCVCFSDMFDLVLPVGTTVTTQCDSVTVLNELNSFLVCMYVCMYVCVYMTVCMTVCIYVYVCICLNINCRLAKQKWTKCCIIKLIKLLSPR